MYDSLTLLWSLHFLILAILNVLYDFFCETPAICEVLEVSVHESVKGIFNANVIEPMLTVKRSISCITQIHKIITQFHTSTQSVTQNKCWLASCCCTCSSQKTGIGSIQGSRVAFASGYKQSESARAIHNRAHVHYHASSFCSLLRIHSACCVTSVLYSDPLSSACSSPRASAPLSSFETLLLTICYAMMPAHFAQ